MRRALTPARSAAKRDRGCAPAPMRSAAFARASRAHEPIGRKRPQALKFLRNFPVPKPFRHLTLPGPSAITRLHLDRGRSSGVEHNLAKVRVGRSIRLARSRFFQQRLPIATRCYPSAKIGRGNNWITAKVDHAPSLASSLSLSKSPSDRSLANPMPIWPAIRNLCFLPSLVFLVLPNRERRFPERSPNHRVRESAYS